ncbi:MAG: NAD(P)-binding protein, partial [Myxococcales bacterium]|nr:NAD(P)-binding protein [Myxococcales bacterium]
MRTHILGGGPAGLYLAILLKKSDPRREVHVFERNAPDDTFGWGVVFSDETLGNLEGADPETYRAITDAFAYWDSLDIHYRGTCIRSSGHGFCGMSRKRLLGILQARAKELGVEITFRHDVEDPAKIREGCDLFVAADGVNSRTRALYEDRFRPSIDRRKCRYIWLGSHKSLPAFTFSFRENEHGIFQIHAYQFEEGTSTFIVECDEQ